MNQGKRYAALVALALSLASAPAFADVRFNANCGAFAGCTFTNTGDERGSACAVLTLSRPDGQTIQSSPVCSGTVEPNSTGAPIPVQFITPVGTFCAESTCTPSVRLENLRSDEQRGVLGYLVPVLLAVSASWVYFDAKKRGARRGLHPGFFDFGPGGWAFATLLAWVIAFPAYLARRAEIAERAAQQPPSA